MLSLKTCLGLKTVSIPIFQVLVSRTQVLVLVWVLWTRVLVLCLEVSNNSRRPALWAIQKNIQIMTSLLRLSMLKRPVRLHIGPCTYYITPLGTKAGLAIWYTSVILIRLRLHIKLTMPHFRSWSWLVSSGLGLVSTGLALVLVLTMSWGRGVVTRGILNITGTQAYDDSYATLV